MIVDVGDKTKPDLRVMTCNYIHGTSAISEGAKAYFFGGFNGDGFERRRFIVRTRSGRWIIKWENVKHLTNWRYTTVSPETGFLYDQLDHYGTPFNEAYDSIPDW